VIVVDASVLTDFLLGRAEALRAVGQALEGHAQEPLHAPELIELEMLNALRSLARGKAITGRRASEAVSDLGSLRLIRYTHEPLRERVWDLRHNLTAYDASYVALAELLDGSLLLTSDHGLATSARRALGKHRVRLVP
jgi:predicted nucleic acid-binding protein